MACFYNKDIKHTCYSKKEVIEFINNHKIRNAKIFATNLAFDFLGSLYEESHRWDVAERNGTIYSFTWYQSDKIDLRSGKEVMVDPVHFFDTVRIFPASVEQLGKLLNIPKMEHPDCFGKIPQNEEEQIALMTYCMNDAKISYEFVRKIVIPFLNKYHIDIRTTIGSIAMADYRTNHLPFDLFAESEEIKHYAFMSYYGGRTETFKRGHFKNVYCFDINSLYPSAMLEDMPNPNKSHEYEKGDVYGITHYEGVSDVLVHVPEHMYMPPLPLKKDGKLVFPTGTFRSYYNHNELRNAMDYGVKILEVHKQLIYPEKYPFFRSFVNEHYSERLTLQAINNPLERMEKLVLNNLYGKWAFNYHHSSVVIPAHKFDYDKHVLTATNITPVCDGKFVTLEKENDKAPIYSFPIFSSYISSYARIKMYKYLANPQLKDKLISTDTDSIFLSDYKGEIPTSTELGAMKLEDGYPVLDGFFIRPKMYKTHKPKCKGVKFSSKEEERNEQWESILNRERITQERFVKFRTAIRSKDHHKFGTLNPNEIIQITKTCDLEDTKRIWSCKFDKDGKQDSNPLHLTYEENIAT